MSGFTDGDELRQHYQSIHATLHRLWSRSVGTPGYDKTEWKALDDEVMRFAVKAGASRPLRGLFADVATAMGMAHRLENSPTPNVIVMTYLQTCLEAMARAVERAVERNIRANP